MSGSLRRFAAITRLSLKQPFADLADPINRIHPFLKNRTKTQAREYVRFPNVVRKVREYEISSSLFSSSFSSSSSSSMASFGKLGFVGWYLGMVKSWPVLTKSVTSSAIYVAADLSSQTISKSSSEPYDLVRTSRMAGYGLLILGPSLHLWFNLMSKLFPKRDLISTLKKMAMGQLLYGPTMTVVFFSLNARLQGESGDEIISRLKRDLLPTMLNGIMYWPFCDFITFRFIPVHLQVNRSSPTGKLPLSFPPSSKLNSGSPATTTHLLVKKPVAPVTKEELGRATWTFLHTLAAQYPERPTRQQTKDVKQLMSILSRMYPCNECAGHFEEVLRANPVQAGSHEEFSQWLCHVHNVINRSLGKVASHVSELMRGGASLSASSEPVIYRELQ
ncbi:FAD-linked sulfhydryl oxidase ERV1 -like protein [Gossypium arboreum]|uniref:Sulfhydryl oxidase n=2 Tax=Gossypium arboreum TaxID=29729 RepID=A0A0B0MH38_GOSAR|nr:hypothetical protein PVK06_046704 [Gossypium arboreum]KHG00105.1 FAD-linked sulfhydryl oxidase ERV1 -like protein [Gossypium arboreum]